MQNATTIIELNLAAIVPGNNDRTHFPQDHIERLAASIQAEGLHQPITVRPLADGTYQIIAGECRYRACQHINRGSIPAIVKPMDDRAASLAMLSENIQRRQLDPMDEAMAYSKRVNEFKMSADEIARWANVSADLVRRRLALLDLLPDVQQQVKAGSLPLGHAEAMAGLDRNNQVAALRALTQSDGALPTVKVFRRICGELLAKQQQSAMFDLDSLWQEKLAEAEVEKSSKKRQRDELAELARQRDELAAERDRIAAELAAYKEWRQLQYRAIALAKKNEFKQADYYEKQAQEAYQSWKQIAAA